MSVPSADPSSQPSLEPNGSPSAQPVDAPSAQPSVAPTSSPVTADGSVMSVPFPGGLSVIDRMMVNFGYDNAKSQGSGFLNLADGMHQVSDTSVHSFVHSGTSDSSFYPFGNNTYGWTLTRLDDINGDFYRDVSLCSPYRAICYIYFCLVRGCVGVSRGFTITGSTHPVSDMTGISIITVDLDGDKNMDTIYAAPRANGERGEICGLWGKREGFGNVDLDNLSPEDGFCFVGDHVGSNIGVSLAALGIYFLLIIIFIIYYYHCL
jgi:hypothetical protein